MAASVRAHANLELFLARKCIARFSQPLDPYWGEHSDTVDRHHAIFHLQLAYRCHLADLCEQREISLRPVSAQHGCADLERMGQTIPEMVELAEREVHQPWLQNLLAEDFLPLAVSTASAADDVIAVSTAGRVWDETTLNSVADELQSLFDRHRDGQQEY